MGVTRRDVPDPGGKPVDVHDVPPYLSAIVFEPRAGVARDDVTRAVVTVMTALRARAKRERERDFTVWFGTMSDAYAEHLRVRGVVEPRWVVALPETFLAEVHIAFQNAVRKHLGEIIDIGRAATSDLGVTPLARYAFGTVAVYVDPFDDPAPPYDGTEARSAEVPGERPLLRDRGRRALPSPTAVASPVHSLDTWVGTRTSILDMVMDMTEAASYRGLRARVRDHFGIEVVEVDAPEFVRLGALTAGWLNDGGCTLRISIRKHLAPELKYIALAHELAHYVRHFPLLYCGQIVEETAWVVPELEGAFRMMVRDLLGDDARRLEYDANVLASYLLIPPMYDLDAMASLMFEGGRTLSGADLAWRFLQPLFPVRDVAAADPSWTSVDEGWLAMERDMAFEEPWDEGGDELYDAFVRATVSRDSAGADRVRQRIDQGLADVTEAVFTQVNALMEDDGARTRLRALAGAGADAVAGELSAYRTVLAPLEPGPGMPRRLPLVPASRDRRAWRCVIEPSMGVATVEDWRRERPELAVTLYPFESMPSEEDAWPTV